MTLGDVVNGWLVVSFVPRSAPDGPQLHWTLARIPQGETALGYGRTWTLEQVERRVVVELGTQQ